MTRRSPNEKLVGISLSRKPLPLLFALVFFVIVNGFTTTAQAASISKLINFQGKITKASDGTNVADGAYAIQFKIYDALTAGTLLYTETYDQASGNCTKPTLTSGVFS